MLLEVLIASPSLLIRTLFESKFVNWQARAGQCPATSSFALAAKANDGFRSALGAIPLWNWATRRGLEGQQNTRT